MHETQFEIDYMTSTQRNSGFREGEEQEDDDEEEI